MKHFWMKKKAKITKWSHAYKGYPYTNNAEIWNYFNPQLRLKDIESAIKYKLIGLLCEFRCFKFVTTLIFEFKKIETVDETKHIIFYLNSKAEIVIDEIDIDDVFESIYVTIISSIQKSLGKSLGWIIDSVIDHIVVISKYYPLAGSSYIKSPKELDDLKKAWLTLKILIIMNDLNGV